MNEFDEVENEVPLYERVIKKAGGKGRSKPSHFGFTGSGIILYSQALKGLSSNLKWPFHNPTLWSFILIIM